MNQPDMFNPNKWYGKKSKPKDENQQGVANDVGDSMRDVGKLALGAATLGLTFGVMKGFMGMFKK